MATKDGFSRRSFLKCAGGGLLLTVLPFSALGAGRGGRGGGGDIPVAARVHVGADGAVTVMTGKVEGGQGARTELTQAAAEELRLPPERVALIMGDTDLVPDDGVTAGSRTTPATVPAMRRGAAAARELLAAMAAARWGVDRSAVVVADGKATAPGASGELTYADLASEVAAQPEGPTARALKSAVPADVVLTPVREWKALGTPAPRPNARHIVTGAYRYAADMLRPDMLYGKVLRPPTYSARLKSVDADAGKAPGVTVVQDGEFVGVAAPNMQAAERAIDALSRTAQWDSSAIPPSSEIYDYLRKHANVPANPFTEEMATAAKSLRATYHTAYIAHAPLGTRAGLAEWDGEKLTVWLTTRNPFGCRAAIARAFGMRDDAVRVIVPDYGGGWGGNDPADAGLEAARIAKAAGRPVLVRWSRTEEFSRAYFRPAAVIDIEAGLDAAGKITSWSFVNINSGGSAVDTPYAIARQRCQFVGSASPLKQGSYRALAATANNFAREAFMDELAGEAGQDPLDFRLAHLDNDRIRTALQTAAERFGWKEARQRKQPGVGVGLACGTEKGSVVAACVEVAVDRGKVVVKRVCEAFECGKIMNPANLLSQVQGAIIMGMGAALREQIEFDAEHITNDSFTKYRVPRFRDVPEIDVQLLDRPDEPSAGGGETPIMAVAPAMANAVFDATGRRVRAIPIRLEGDT
jgi:CO/xanthine dehydrogenase Mo-binding subunit